MRNSNGTMLGISFDGLAISGIVNEFLNIATVFRSDGYRILFDLGSDIVHRPEELIDTSTIPHWVRCMRSTGGVLPARYSREMVLEAAQLVIRGTPVSDAGRFGQVCRKLADSIVATMIRESVSVLVVENGTLPDNPLFTEALYMAIADYGRQQGLGKYVIWRDHDLMWSSEPHRYGTYPYPGVRRPAANRYIHYCVVTEWMRRRFEAWTGVSCHVISNRFFVGDELRARAVPSPSFRDAYGIPADALLIARCTRVIPPKSVERDLRLIAALQRRLADRDDGRRVYLFITGPITEHPDEVRHLMQLAAALGIEQQVIWANGLLPYNSSFAEATGRSSQFTIADLLSEAHLSSFLTTYDYEGFGNPPGEAMAMGVPYIATSYEVYHDVYGSKGAIAPLLRIRRDSAVDEPIPDYFIEWVLRVLTDPDYRRQIVARNSAICRRFFSLETLSEQVHELMADT